MGWELPISPRSGRIHTSNQPSFVQDETGDVILDACQFADGSTKDLFFAFPVPGSYASGNGTLAARWRTGATGAGNNAYLGGTYRTSASGNSLTSGGATTITAAAYTADATTNEITESTLSTTISAAARSLVTLLFQRQGGNASDTLSDVLNLDMLVFSGTANPDFTRGSLWASARACRPGSGAVRGNAAYSSMFPGSIQLTDGSTQYAECTFVLPSNYGGGGIYVYPYYCIHANTGNFVFRIDHIAVQSGETWDQALTSGTQFTKSLSLDVLGFGDTNGNATQLSGSFAAGDRITVRFNRLGADGSDTATGTLNLLGLLIEYDLINKNPQTIYLDPVSGSLPAGSTAEVNIVSGTNQTLPIALMPDNEDHTLSLRSRLPDTYESGGTLTIDWVSEGTGDWYVGLEYSTPAVGSDPDPAVTTVAAAAKTSSGAGVVTRTTFSISTGFADADHFNLNIVHEGTNVGHTCGYVRVIGARLTFNVEDPA